VARAPSPACLRQQNSEWKTEPLASSATVTFSTAMPRRSQTSHLRIAIDTGGTFTDCVWVDRGRVRMLKIFSTPADASQAIVEVLKKVGLPSSLTLLHGTTVGTNTLLQRKGARVALVTTAGFEDVIEIGRQARSKLYDLFFDRVQPLVPTDLRFGVHERTSSDGEILEFSTPEELASLANLLRKKSVEAVAVSLLFSFANSKNEIAVTTALKTMGVPISVSHQILPEFREYERTSTVVVNAYLQPIMHHYLENLDRRARGLGARARVFLMQSSGGITTLSAAAHEPVRTILSGPAGGVVGAAAMARRSGYERIISFDMGGTSTDVALVDRQARVSSQSEVAGLAVGVSMLDIHTVGAGGGSIARFDPAGALRVGPESAGADPGPICYGRGSEPTVTDANLLLGRLQPHRFLGGEFTLNIERTQRLIANWLKKNASSLTVLEFAAGVIRVVNATMEKAIRVVSIERGFDPREFTLVSFGGAGGLHACELAKSLSVPRVIVPPLPGALSALGILVSDVVRDYSRTVLWSVSGKLPIGKLEREFTLLRRSADTVLRKEGWKGAIRYQTSVDIRYRGQGHELNIPYSRRVVDDFRREHQRRYGYNYPDRTVELVTLRLRGKVKSSQSQLSSSRLRIDPSPIRSTKRLRAETASVAFHGAKLKTAVHAREVLQPGKKYYGPAVITEYSATTVVPPGLHFSLDKAGSLVIQIK